MTATVKALYRIRLRKSAKGYTFRCSCGEFGRRKTEAEVVSLADKHAGHHARRGEATSVELGALLNSQ